MTEDQDDYVLPDGQMHEDEFNALGSEEQIVEKLRGTRIVTEEEFQFQKRQAKTAYAWALVHKMFSGVSQQAIQHTVQVWMSDPKSAATALLDEYTYPSEVKTEGTKKNNKPAYRNLLGKKGRW